MFFFTFVFFETDYRTELLFELKYVYLAAIKMTIHGRYSVK